MASRQLQVIITGDARGVRQALSQMGGDLDRVGGRADESSGKWAKWSSAIGKGSVVAGAALVAFGAAAVSSASQFESRMSAVEAVSGATGAELDSLRDKALQLGADSSFSATEAASAIEELVKAGLPVEDVLNGAADATVALAAAGEVALPQAATIASNALNAFKLSAEDMPRVADLIAGAANASAIDVDQMGQSLQQASAVAALVGLSFEDTATAIAMMGDAGIVGSDAGTSLKTMLSRLTPQTNQQADAMRELGLLTETGTSKFFDQAGELQSLETIAGTLQGALQGLSREQQITALQTIFGADAVRAAAVLMSEGAEGAREYGDAINEIGAEEVAATRLDNLAGSVEKFKGAVETFMISSAGGLNEWLRELVDSGTAAVEWLNNPPTGFTDFLDDVGARALPILRDVIDAGQNLGDVLLDLASDARPAAEGIAALGGGAVVASLTATASILKTTTGAMVDHREVVAAVAVAYGAYLARAQIAAVVSAGTTALQASRAAWAAVSVAVGMATVSTTTYTSATLTAGIAADVLRTKFHALTAGASGAALAVAALGAAVALGYVSYRKWQDAGRSKGNEWIESFKEGIDPASLASYGEAAQKAEDMAAGLRDAADESINPFDADYRAELNAGAGELEKYAEAARAAVDDASDGMNALRARTGLSADELSAWADKLGVDLVPALMDGSANVDELATQIDSAARLANEGSPATEQLAAAYTTLSDETSTATERIDAWSEAVDAALGKEMDVFGATTAFSASLAELTTQLAGNKAGIDDNTEAGRANRDALQGAAEDAIALAEAYGRTGDVEAANFVLAANREKLIEAGLAAGATRAEMELYLAALGMTPEAIATTLQLEGAEPVEAAIDHTTRPRDTPVNVRQYGADAADRIITNAARRRDARVDVEHYGADAADRVINHVARDRTARIGIETFMANSGGHASADAADRRREDRAGRSAVGATALLDRPVIIENHLDGKAVGRSRPLYGSLADSRHFDRGGRR